jgi:uncharacterized membrane protein (DUF485 family)
MSVSPDIAKIVDNPKYKDLVKERDSLSWMLTIFVLVIYFGFTLLIAFAPEFLTQTIAEDSVIPLGMPLGVGVILLSILSTAVYVRRANTKFDDMIRDILQGIGK